MDDSRLDNLNELEEFLKATNKVQLSLKYESIEEKYRFIQKIVKKFSYLTLAKKQKRIVLRYLHKITGYKKSQLMHLIARAEIGDLERKVYERKNPRKIYDTYDIKLLEHTDEMHLRMNAMATREVLRREYEVFKKSNYENISHVSVSHINNLRKYPQYHFYWINHTKSIKSVIGKTKKPNNQGIPGSIRIDTIHQKDIYHVNGIDEVTQWEVFVAVPEISEFFMRQALKELIEQFPFRVFGFHSDRGSEYINYTVSELLNKLLIEQTKSRARKTTDNALVESKNAHIFRKNFGWKFITKDQEIVGAINRFYQDYFNPYLVYHRPCLFPKDQMNVQGKVIKVYEEVKVPYEKFKLICKQKHTNYLKTGLTFRKLDKIAYEKSDNEFAYEMRIAKLKIDKLINERNSQIFS